MKPAVDSLWWLLFSLLLVMLPHVPRLPWWTTALLVLCAVWRLASTRGQVRPPGRWVIGLLGLVCAAGIALHYRHLFGREASTTLLVVMLALKLLEMRNRRDHLLVIYLAYFLVATHFLDSQAPGMVMYMLVTVLMITATLISLHHPAAALQPGKTLRQAGILLLQALPLMLVLFLLFPRIPGPFWGLPQDAHGGLSGLSEDMEPGSLSELSLSDEVAFRAEFESEPPPVNQLYWRGPVLWHTDGRKWSAGNRPHRFVRTAIGASQPVRYAVTLEPHNRRWVLVLDTPLSVGPPGRLVDDLQALTTKPVQTRLRYEATASLRERAGVASAQELAYALQLPAGGNGRARALAREWAGQNRDADAIVQAALQYFRSEAFVYTLAPPLLHGDTVDAFLFETRQGFCEHFAGSFVFLMRAAGVPARVVIGYLGGEYNPVGRYVLVRQSEAHAWAEVWISGRGWVRVDPTAVVSPERIERGGQVLQAGRGHWMGELVRRSDWLVQARFMADWLNNGWNQWVLGYNNRRQADLLSRWGLESPGERLYALLVMLALVLLPLAVWLFARRRRIDPPVRLYARFCRKLAHIGYERQPNEGPLAFSQRVEQAEPALAAEVAAITAAYIDLRYGGGRAALTLTELRQRVARFNPRVRP